MINKNLNKNLIKQYKTAAEKTLKEKIKIDFDIGMKYMKSDDLKTWCKNNLEEGIKC